jgi:hypothetical protein
VFGLFFFVVPMGAGLDINFFGGAGRGGCVKEEITWIPPVLGRIVCGGSRGGTRPFAA